MESIIEPITDEQRKSAKRAYFREYMNDYRKNYYDRTFSDYKQRQNPEYKERERLRHKKRYERQKQFRMFQEAMPSYLFI
jgi:hypothetical protein